MPIPPILPESYRPGPDVITNYVRGENETPEQFFARVRADSEKAGEFKRPRIMGHATGKIVVHPSFFDPLPDDELKLWNCEADEEEKS